MFFKTLRDRRWKLNIRFYSILNNLMKLLFILILIIGVFGFNQLIKNGLYGSECVAAAETAKKSNFAEQLKLLQENADTVDEKSLEGGALGGNQDYGDIFSDPNLFKDFGGFDTKED